MIAPLTPEMLEALRAEHGKVYTLDVGDDDDGGTIAFGWASSADTKRFQLAIEKGGDGAHGKAARDLCESIMLHPKRGQELTDLMGEFGFLAIAVADETIRMQRGAAPDRAKKVRPAKSGQ